MASMQARFPETYMVGTLSRGGSASSEDIRDSVIGSGAYSHAIDIVARTFLWRSSVSTLTVSLKRGFDIGSSL